MEDDPIRHLAVSLIAKREEALLPDVGNVKIAGRLLSLSTAISIRLLIFRAGESRCTLERHSLHTHTHIYRVNLFRVADIAAERRSPTLRCVYHARSPLALLSKRIANLRHKRVHFTREVAIACP